MIQHCQSTLQSRVPDSEPDLEDPLKCTTWHPTWDSAALSALRACCESLSAEMVQGRVGPFQVFLRFGASGIFRSLQRSWLLLPASCRSFKAGFSDLVGG